MRLRVVLICGVLTGIVAVAFIHRGLGRQSSNIPREVGLDDLNHSIEPLLQSLPGVADVEVHTVKNPTSRIVHLRDWHFISKELFAIDQRGLPDKAIADEEIDRLYMEFLQEVDSVQTEQMTLLGTIIREHGLKRIFAEGLTHHTLPNYREKIGVLKDMERNQISKFRFQLKEVRELVDAKSGSEIDAIEQKIVGLLDDFKWNLVEMGAAGRLLVRGEIDEVLPAEDEELLDAANPIAAGGLIQFNAQKIQARRDAIVTNVLNEGPCALLILGGEHDLTDNVRRVSGGTCEYIRVTLKRYKEVSEE